MSTEVTEPTPNYGDDGHSAPTIPTAAGEGGSSSPNGGSSGRRRRRRRKNKSQNPNGASAQTVAVAQVAPQPSSSNEEEGAPLPAPRIAVPAPVQSGLQQPGGGKRKKRNRPGGPGGPPAGAPNGSSQPRQHQARSGGGGWRRNPDGPDGNREGARGGFGSEHFQDANGNGGGRRKGKFGRRGAPGFVGPMDHSYRAVNGNVADGPPSTMDYRNGNGNANGNVNARNDFADAEAPSAMREDAPTRIVCFIEDLFIVTKMNETARKLGIKIQFAKAEKDTLAAITDGPEGERPALIVFDLNNAGAKPLTVIPKLKAKLKRGTSIIGFLQHIQGDLKLKAVEAGCDTVMPRSAFSLSLPNLLRRYGLHEEEMAEA